MFLLSESLIINNVNYPNDESFCFLFSTTAPTHTNSAVCLSFTVAKRYQQSLAQAALNGEMLKFKYKHTILTKSTILGIFGKIFFEDKLS